MSWTLGPKLVRLKEGGFQIGERGGEGLVLIQLLYGDDSLNFCNTNLEQ